MNQPLSQHRRACIFFLFIALSLAGPTPSVSAQDDRDDVPTGARRAAEWEPGREGGGGDPWHLGASVGFAFFSGDAGVDGEPGFLAEVHASRDLTEDIYVVGSYAIGFARTEVTDPLDGSDVRDTAVLHVPTVGIGFRLEVTPEVRFFIEPKIGALFGDADAAPAGGASAGVDIELDPGIAVRVGFTGLLTDSSLDTDAGDVDLTGIWSVGVGLVFEF